MKNYSEDIEKYITVIRPILDSLISELDKKPKKVLIKSLDLLTRQNPKDGNTLFSRDELISAYRALVEKKELKEDQRIIEILKLKPIRTISGIIPITVLTKPYPCPGNCIFCPNDVRMPKSYIATEPGAQRALRNACDPYLQTYNRLLALQNIGHTVDKVELIILGGTWSFYPKQYQIWYVKRCFEALNDFGTGKDQRFEIPVADFTDPFSETKVPVNYNLEINKIGLEKSANSKDVIEGGQVQSATWAELEEQQILNVNGKVRCVGLVLETRPDHISQDEVINLRRLGATKVQIGIQSLNDEILKLNNRGTTVTQIKRAIRILRTAGFKIHAHWMPNLYGATVESDKKDYLKLWGPDFSPDELKIYPTSIIKGTVLSTLYEEGKYIPYTLDELKDLLKFCFENTPRFVRLTRIIRDIPSDDIQAGNKKSNLRQIVELEMSKEGKYCECIRCREIQDQEFKASDLSLETIDYETSVGKEKFISFRTPDNDNLDPKNRGDRIVGFLRLLLPDLKISRDNFITELSDCAIIREVHVYGQVEKIGTQGTDDKAQHTGLGKKLILEAEAIAKKAGFKRIAVISAIGTRDYYKKLGFELDRLYSTKKLS